MKVAFLFDPPARNFYDGAAAGGYMTSPKFPNPYTSADSDSRTVMIPSGFNYAVVSFSYFKLAAGDRVTLVAAGAPSGVYTGGSSATVPGSWVSMSAATSFQVSFSVSMAPHAGLFA